MLVAGSIPAWPTCLSKITTDWISMQYDNISSDDDDLFNDDVFSQSSSSSSSYSDDNFNVQNILKSLDISEEQLDTMILRARIVTTLIDSSCSFIYETNSFTRSIFNSLNSLTDNQFQFNLYIETLEESIIRRMIVLRFLNTCTEEMDESLINIISKATKSTIDARFLNTYIRSMRDMMAYAVDYNLAVYTKLCEQVNRVPIDFSIENSEMVDSYFNQGYYINNVFRNIRKSLGFGIKLESD